MNTYIINFIKKPTNLETLGVYQENGYWYIDADSDRDAIKRLYPNQKIMIRSAIVVDAKGEPLCTIIKYNADHNYIGEVKHEG